MRVKKGFTLIEIVVSLAIIGIMMIPLANSLIMSVKANKMGEIVQESKNISQEIVEGVRSLGDVKETTLKVGSNNEAVQIKVDVGEDGKYTVDGIVDDIILKGNIKKTDKGGTIEYESDKYLERNVSLVFYCYIDATRAETEIEKNKNRILYSYIEDAVTIAEHIESIEQYIKIGTPTSTSINMLEDSDKIVLEIDKITGSDGAIKNEIVIDDRYYTHVTGKDSILEGEYISRVTTSPDIAIFIKDRRLGNDLEVSPFIGLDIESKISESNLYFFNNKFKEGEKGTATNEGIPENIVVDSFDKDRYIGKTISVKDNIKFGNFLSKNNKGLYTIDIDTEAKINGVKENTRSEFIVSD